MADKTQAVTDYLDEQGIEYELVEHGERFTAAGEARASGVGPEDAAKEVALRKNGGYVFAVLQASDRLDLNKVRELLDEAKLRLATEDELAEDFPQFELGALPPFGSMLAIEQVVDERLLDHDRVLCNAGDHRHSLKVDPSEFVRLTGARVADIRQD
jgi:Ala-tRNA(Pro) deacylase